MYVSDNLLKAQFLAKFEPSGRGNWSLGSHELHTNPLTNSRKAL